jgi:hypothetical protein
MFFQQQVAKVLFEAIDHCQRGKRIQVGLQLGLLFRFEVMTVAAHQREQTAVFAGNRIYVLPAGQEVMVDQEFWGSLQLGRPPPSLGSCPRVWSTITKSSAQLILFPLRNRIAISIGML